MTQVSLVGTRLPAGTFTIEPEAHRVFTDAVFAGPWRHELAHPLFLHIVAHCGKGMALEEFFALIGTELEAGVTFGQGRLEYLQPLRIGETYRVETEIVAVERKHGRRRGPFDVVTTRQRVLDAAGTPVGVSTESYVVPKEAA
jgi:acyl dehydratase